MTEKTAKLKWCPKRRPPTSGGVGDIAGACCIASECMMWNWYQPRLGTPRHGYCGLAGKSEMPYYDENGE